LESNGEITSNQSEIIEALRARVVAEEATRRELERQNDLAKSTLTELTRSRAADQLRTRLAFETNDKLTGLIPQIQKVFQDIENIRMQLEELSRADEQTKDILLLLLTEHNQGRVGAAIDDLQAEINESESSRKKRLKIRIRNLSKLQEQAAYHGRDVPIDLQNDIEAEEAAIEILKSAGKSRGPP
jgi:flagellar basal body-associated protein FliL